MISLDERRRLNILDNKRILVELGLSNPFTAPLKVVHKPIKRKRARSDDDSAGAVSAKRPKKQFVVAVTNNVVLTPGMRRKSCRLQGKEFSSAPDVDEADQEEGTPLRVAPNRPNSYGAIPDVEVGAHWLTRMECCHALIHRPPVAGIHGNEEEGAYSLALSGGYEDDIDLGVCFTYTGEGGRDLKGTKNNPKNLRTASQSKDQTLTRGNLALSKNFEMGNPVRVIRGYKLDSLFAPTDGYRYDGLYSVEKHWFTTGMSGHGVWKFALRRCDSQDPPPWDVIEFSSEHSEQCSMNGDATASGGKSGAMDDGISEEGNCNANDSVNEEMDYEENKTEKSDGVDVNCFSDELDTKYKEEDEETEKSETKIEEDNVCEDETKCNGLSPRNGSDVKTSDVVLNIGYDDDTAKCNVEQTGVSKGRSHEGHHKKETRVEKHAGSIGGEKLTGDVWEDGCGFNDNGGIGVASGSVDKGDGNDGENGVDHREEPVAEVEFKDGDIADGGVKENRHAADAGNDGRYGKVKVNEENMDRGVVEHETNEAELKEESLMSDGRTVDVCDRVDNEVKEHLNEERSDERGDEDEIIVDTKEFREERNVGESENESDDCDKENVRNNGNGINTISVERNCVKKTKDESDTF